MRERGAAAGAAAARRRPPRRRAVPDDLGREHKGTASTQQAFGRFFVDLVREAPEVAERVVTVSPDVGTSTNLGGWINKAGIWNPGDRIDWFADDTDTLVRWRETDHGRHIELGIAEVNLVGLLGELGATWSRDGQPLLPVGTIYDPFVARALEPWSFGIYAGGQSILVGTPSGVTLGPEGGAHQSVITPSIGIEQPGCTFWEPAFGQDLEWAFLHALSRLGREDGEAAYFRLSTRPLDQSLQNGTREEVLSGGYRLRPADDPRVVIAVMGALVPEAVEAADILRKEADAEAEVVCITSADLLYRSFQARAGLADADPAVLDRLFPHDAPVITLLDGHPHTLSFLGDVCLGVQRFGQSGDLAELYEHHAIDAESVVGAALDLMDAMSFTTRPELRGTFGMVASTHWLASGVGHVGARARGQRVRRRGRHRVRAAGRRAAPQRAGRRRAGGLLLQGRRTRCGCCAARGRRPARRRSTRIGRGARPRPGHRAARGGRAGGVRRLAADAARARHVGARRRDGAGDHVRARRLSGGAGDHGRHRGGRRPTAH